MAKDGAYGAGKYSNQAIKGEEDDSDIVDDDEFEEEEEKKNDSSSSSSSSLSNSSSSCQLPSSKLLEESQSLLVSVPTHDLQEFCEEDGIRKPNETAESKVNHAVF